MKLIMRVKVAIVAIFCILIASPLLVHGQTEVPMLNLIAKLNAKTYHMTALDKALMDLNISNAYSFDPNINGSPTVWRFNTNKYYTHYYLPANSLYLKLSSKEKYAQFEAKVNGLRLGLAQALTGATITTAGASNEVAADTAVTLMSGKLFSETSKFLDVEFVTNEGNQFYVIARYKDGKLQLVRKKMNMPKL